MLPNSSSFYFQLGRWERRALRGLVYLLGGQHSGVPVTCSIRGTRHPILPLNPPKRTHGPGQYGIGLLFETRFISLVNPCFNRISDYSPDRESRCLFPCGASNLTAVKRIKSNKDSQDLDLQGTCLKPAPRCSQTSSSVGPNTSVLEVTYPVRPLCLMLQRRRALSHSASTSSSPPPFHSISVDGEVLLVADPAESLWVIL